MSHAGHQRVLIVGDTLAFGRVIQAVIESGIRTHTIVHHTTYEGFRAILTPRLIKYTGLFILDLWRTYSTGLRAEGLAVAEELLRQHALSLVVSSLSCAVEGDMPFYWDLASTQDITTRCEHLLQGNLRQASKGAESLGRLKYFLCEYLAKPSGHDTDKSENGHCVAFHQHEARVECSQ